MVKSTTSLQNDMALQLQSFEESSVVVMEARLRQSEFGRKFVGKTYLAEEQEEYIDEFLKEDNLVANLIDPSSVSYDAAFRLLTRFEAMCKRREVPIRDNTVRDSTYRLLVLELYINQNELGYSAEKLVTATLLNRDILASIPYEKGLIRFLRKYRSMLARSLDSNPADIRKDLHARKKALSELSAKYDLPRSTIMRFVFGYKDPELSLEQALRAVEGLMKSKAHRGFLRGKSSLAMHAVLEHGPERASRYLRNVRKELHRLQKIKSLAYFKRRPGYILYAITHHPNNPGKHLQNALRTAREYLKANPHTNASIHSVIKSTLRGSAQQGTKKVPSSKMTS